MVNSEGEKVLNVCIAQEPAHLAGDRHDMLGPVDIHTLRYLK